MEALCLDSIGNILSLSVSGLPTKLGIALSVFGAYNFIIDHCGYVFPFSVLPTECDTLFHDIHHQPWGLKVSPLIMRHSALRAVLTAV